ncbi:MAG TPA: sarcosine oxidase subunit delta [Ilumatobacteraceae bacterium]|jgi:heterotetrameric sarcosine oxidase delta subunit
MLWLTCPICGRRPIDEFLFGGEMPAVPDRITDPGERDVDYVWMFNNTRGVTIERWFHHAGCRRWQTVQRDTVTDSVVEGATTDTVM